MRVRRSNQLSLLSLRGFMPDVELLDAQTLREMWRARFIAKGPDHPFWLYTHIPFCSQICSYCQCSTQLKRSDDEIERYLAWLADEMAYFAPAAATGLVRWQYVGGGTVNILSEPQLERLFSGLNAHFRFATDARRTFEFLPSSLRPETLPLARAFGFNRLSCGVQTTAPTLLARVNRVDNSMIRLAAAITQATELGFDEINLDLIWGFDEQRPSDFGADLERVLALGATTITVHRLVRARGDAADDDPAAEIAVQREFQGLQRRYGAHVEAIDPHLRWLLRPNSWVLATAEFFASSRFSLWYFSDNERIHIDMLSLGRYAHSNILGQVLYENVATSTDFDPQAKTYRSFAKSPIIDAALDVVTELVGEGHSDLGPVAARYGEAAVDGLRPTLQQLCREGVLRGTANRWQMPDHDGVFVDQVAPLLETAMAATERPWLNPRRRARVDEVRIGDGARTLIVQVRAAAPKRQSYAAVGPLAVSYRIARGQAVDEDRTWVRLLMDDLVRRLTVLVSRRPGLTAREAVEALRVSS